MVVLCSSVVVRDIRKIMQHMCHGRSFEYSSRVGMCVVVWSNSVVVYDIRTLRSTCVMGVCLSVVVVLVYV